MDQPNQDVLRFDRFTLDLARGCLRDEAQELPLRPKAFEVLRYLVENAGRLVSKKELIETVWPDVVVTDDSLMQCIRELRERLGDENHNLIKTLSRRGYRLDAIATARGGTSSPAELNQRVAALEEQLREVEQQQAATADILRAISRPTFNLQAVLDTLVEAAARLCNADKAQILRPKSDAGYYCAASYGFPFEYAEYVRTATFPADRGSVVGRIQMELRPVQIADVLADPEYVLREAQKLGGYRTHLGVPMLRGGTLIGVILVSRAVVRPFTEKHIELISTFASQAVIAIENVRLIDELHEKGRQLQVALQRRELEGSSS